MNHMLWYYWQNNERIHVIYFAFGYITLATNLLSFEHHVAQRLGDWLWRKRDTLMESKLTRTWILVSFLCEISSGSWAACNHLHTSWVCLLAHVFRLPRYVNSSLAHSRLPAVSRKKTFPESHIINPLLTKFVRSRWLDNGLVLFCEVMDLNSVSSINTQKKNLANIQPSLPHNWSRTHLHR